MEGAFATVLASGNGLAIAVFVACWVIIHFRDKATNLKLELADKKAAEELEKMKAEQQKKREEATAEMKKQLEAFKLDKELMKKDIETLKVENHGIKEDVKEIKSTLNNMAVSLAEIAAGYKMLKVESNNTREGKK